uniref:hypothetical protein n=1 Tax=Mesorhizobium caraganae TaxID=483206 RepID=UPI001785A5AA
MGTANDTVYGLASYIQTKDIQKAREVAARMRTDNAIGIFACLPAIRAQYIRDYWRTCLGGF